MISWFKFYKNKGLIVALGQHDTGVCCFMDSSITSGHRLACALVNTNGYDGKTILKGLKYLNLHKGTAGQVTEQLDHYITEHAHDYLYQWPALNLEGFTEYFYPELLPA